MWVMTPFLTAKLVGKYATVDAAGLPMSSLQVVLLPVMGGAFLNQYFQGLVRFVSPVMLPIAVLTGAVLCGNTIAQCASSILISGRQVVLAAALLHACGFFFGYVLARLLGIDVSSSRTISIEVGMQNSVLGVVLASRHFRNPLTAVPCAVSSVCHSIFGSTLAGIWRRSIPDPDLIQDSDVHSLNSSSKQSRGASELMVCAWILRCFVWTIGLILVWASIAELRRIIV